MNKTTGYYVCENGKVVRLKKQTKDRVKREKIRELKEFFDGHGIKMSDDKIEKMASEWADIREKFNVRCINVALGKEKV